mgnify:CR=1 FL=1|tara:strand:- start:4759 stop:5793 length:1035 start_codon:yes stop_codon:yes gene_type:complete
MSTEQVVTYRKPAFIEKAQADLIKAIEDFIAKDAAKGLPERDIVGLSQTQKDAIAKLKQGLGSFDPALTDALDAITKGTDVAAAKRPDFTAAGQKLIDDAIATKFDVTKDVDPFMDQYNKFVIDEINKQAALSGKKIDDAATKVGAFGGDREAVAKAQLDEARLAAIGKTQADTFERALKSALGVFGQEESEKLKGAQLAPYFTSADSKAQTDQAKSLIAAGQVGGGLASLASKLGLADISALLGAGSLEQKAAQDAANIEFQNIMAAQERPLSLFGFLSDVVSGLPSDQGTQIRQEFGSDTSPLQTALGFGSAALGIPGLAKDGGDMGMIEKGIMALQHGSKS